MMYQEKMGSALAVISTIASIGKTAWDAYSDSVMRTIESDRIKAQQGALSSSATIPNKSIDLKRYGILLVAGIVTILLLNQK